MSAPFRTSARPRDSRGCRAIRPSRGCHRCRSDWRDVPRKLGPAVAVVLRPPGSVRSRAAGRVVTVSALLAAPVVASVQRSVEQASAGMPEPVAKEATEGNRPLVEADPRLAAAVVAMVVANKGPRPESVPSRAPVDRQRDLADPDTRLGASAEAETFRLRAESETAEEREQRSPAFPESRIAKREIEAAATVPVAAAVRHGVSVLVSV